MITHPRLENVRFIPEAQLEPDDDVEFEFTVVNEAPEFAMVVSGIQVTFVPGPNLKPPVPVVLSRLSTRPPGGETGNEIAAGFLIPPKSTIKVYGTVSTQSKLSPGLLHPYNFSMGVLITKMQAVSPVTPYRTFFQNDGLATLTGVISLDKGASA